MIRSNLLPVILTEDAIADLLEVPLMRVRQWRRQNKIGPFFTIGREHRMRRETFTAWMKSREA